MNINKQVALNYFVLMERKENPSQRHVDYYDVNGLMSLVDYVNDACIYFDTNGDRIPIDINEVEKYIIKYQLLK